MKKLITIIPILFLCLFLTGCLGLGKQPIWIYPVEKSDIFTMPSGATVKIAAGTQIIKKDKKGNDVVVAEWTEDTEIYVEKDGRFLSDFVMNEIVEAKEVL